MTAPANGHRDDDDHDGHCDGTVMKRVKDAVTLGNGRHWDTDDGDAHGHNGCHGHPGVDLHNLRPVTCLLNGVKRVSEAESTAVSLMRLFKDKPID